MEYLYRLEHDHAVITGGSPDCMVMQIPEQIEGLPVTGIAPHAFEGSKCPVFSFPDTLTQIGAYAFHDCQSIQELTLPKHVKEIGAYAFYDCHHLRELNIADSIRILDNNSFLGCDGLTLVRMDLYEGRHQSLKTMLSEWYQEVVVELRYVQTGEFARIVFPEYFVEYIENHEARLFEEYTIGSGRVYRKFFSGADFDYTSYDRHFDIACVKDLAPQAARVAVSRLRYPYKLQEADRVRYLVWLKGHALRACTQFVEKEEMEVLQLLHELGVIGGSHVDAFLDVAAGKSGSVLSWLMQIGRPHFQKKEVDFEL